MTEEERKEFDELKKKVEWLENEMKRIINYQPLEHRRF
jgi:hypothetical protein